MVPMADWRPGLKAFPWTAAALVLAMVAVAGCGAGRIFSKGEEASRAGDWDAAVTFYEQAVEANPKEATYKIALDRAKVSASRMHLEKAIAHEQKDELEPAIAEYKRAAEYDPTNRRASARAADLEKVLRDRAEAARPRPAIEAMKEKAKQTAAEPMLNPASRQPLVFKFAAGISVKQILDFLAQASGINVMFESAYQEVTTKSAIDLDGVTLEQALNLVLTSNTLFYKVLNARTILIIPDTQQNRAKYEDQVIRTFYLSHADATETLTLLNTLMGTAVGQARPMIAPNKNANSITIRGSASLVAIAERIIENNDKPRAEVVIDVEILEVNRTRVKQYGLNLSNYAIGIQFSPEAPPGGLTTPSTPGSPPAAGSPVANTGQFNLNSIAHGINTSDFYLTVPSAVVKFLESDSRTKLIAKPSLRGAEGAKLVANLGDEIPVPSTTFQPLMAGGTAINPMTSYQYRPVGVNVSVTPRVTYDGDIILDLEVESSTKGSDVNVAGTNLPSFGQRKVTTRMRLRDGESNLLAGLLRDDERKSLTGFPGGIHVPVIKQLFSANESQISQTDIVMLLTPHIIRTQALTDRNLQEIYIGTAQNPVLGGVPPLIGSPGDAAAGQPPVIEAPPVAAAPTQSITTMPYGSPGSALVGGAPVGKPTPQGTPVVPPGSSPIPGTVMMPPEKPAAQPPAQQPVVTPAPQAQAPPVTPPTAAPAPAPAPPTGQPAGAGQTTVPAGAKPPAAASPYGLPATATPSAPAQVTVTTPGPDWRIGQGPYTVTLSALNMPRVTTITLTVTYNPTALKIRSLQEGSFMRTGVPGTAFAHQEDNAAGRIDLTISRSGDIVGATGGGTLAALVFDAAAAGSVNFRVSGVASGPGGSIPLQFTPATVTVR
jgi:general secretion pathway protein D